MAKYIVDIDALKDCLGLLKKPTIINGLDCVYLKDVKVMIDMFPKDEYGIGYREQLNAAKEMSISINDDILSGKGLKPLR